MWLKKALEDELPLKQQIISKIHTTIDFQAAFERYQKRKNGKKYFCFADLFQQTTGLKSAIFVQIASFAAILAEFRAFIFSTNCIFCLCAGVGVAALLYCQ
ncbi:MAG: hypothetical protein IT261_10435 [Saprospiraceae bacterium]|nr:hypothetical protein [Saprospiraceae bacterium]